MKILTFSLVTLALLAAPTGRAQFVPGPNPIAGTVTAAQTLASATITVSGIILGRLPLGTTFTVISNTAATPIAGTFANLHDGSIL
ncbi:MAG TPA: hypothetical protein VFH87_14570, partial [Candidatus Udaeobacter sp.]|nr:hypothetical protein [Candidatus Udaeobacter sp.]